MNYNRNKIRNLLDLVKEQVDIIVNQKGEVPQLYIDMAKENLIKLYEEIHNIEKAKPEVEAEPEAEVKVELKPEVVEIPKPEVKVEIPPQIEEIKEEPKPEPIIEAPKTIERVVAKKPIKKIVESNDLFDSQLSIGEKFQEFQEPAVVDKFQGNQIKNIKSAIGINEKFLFINELFDGNLQKYNQSIEKLDSIATKEEAEQFIEQLDSELNWDQESTAREKLLVFIDRRY